MRPKATRGACAHCGKELTRAGMTKHLTKCLLEKTQATKEKTTPCYHLLVKTRNSSDYWMHLQADANTTLQTLDDFLRNIWLECCGHISAFYLHGHEVNMTRRLSTIFKTGMVVDYDYDMGDTTSLQIEVLEKYPCVMTKKKAIEILARNQLPVITCDECDKNPAAWICPECAWQGNGWLCESCAAKHKCGEEEYFLPVTNSPRVGVCGYTGD